MGKQHGVNIRIDGENPEAVEFFRQLIIGQLEDYIVKQGKVEISTKDKYKGNGLARLSAVVSEEILVVLKGAGKDES